MRLRVQLRCMAASEIAGMIPADAIAEIKKTDPHPIFKAFVIGHEGEAEGNVVGVGNVVKRWYRSVIERLHDKIAVGIQNGLAVFHGHAATNENEGRVSIGRVVGKALKDIGGRLSTIVAVYLNPAHNRRNFDIASIEASVDMEMDKDGGWEVKDVSDVTGLALGSSQLETPGFAGATLLGQLQAFALKQNVSIGIESKPGIVLGYRLNSKQSAAPPAGGNGGSHA